MQSLLLPYDLKDTPRDLRAGVDESVPVFKKNGSLNKTQVA